MLKVGYLVVVLTGGGLHGDSLVSVPFNQSIQYSCLFLNIFFFAHRVGISILCQNLAQSCLIILGSSEQNGLDA